MYQPFLQAVEGALGRIVEKPAIHNGFVHRVEIAQTRFKAPVNHIGRNVVPALGHTLRHPLLCKGRVGQIRPRKRGLARTIGASKDVNA